MIQAIRRIDSRCRILVLSGHADFALAQQAICCGIEGYLLKPVDEVELEQYAQRIARSLDAERGREGRADGPQERRAAALRALLAGEAEAARSLAAAASGAGAPEPGCGAAALWRLLHGGSGGGVLLAEPEPATGEAQAAFRRRLAEAAAARGLGPVFDDGPACGLLLPGGMAALSSAEDLLAAAAGPQGYTGCRRPGHG